MSQLFIQQISELLFFIGTLTFDDIFNQTGWELKTARLF